MDPIVLSPVPHTRVQIEDNFWSPRLDTIRTRTLPAIAEQLKKSGHIDALRLQWKPGDPNPPHIFWESDLAKWIEAACYSLANHPDSELASQVEEVVQLLLSAQQPDGYLNVYFTVVEPGKRWTNLRDNHELYVAGHLIEAAVAHFQATGRSHFLDAMRRLADCIETQFGKNPDQKRGYCGHPEIELALLRLFRVTREERYFALSRYFVEERGTSPHFFDAEARSRGEDPEQYWARTHEYSQSHQPILEQKDARGHAVRALYLLCGVADLSLELRRRQDASAPAWEEALDRLWKSIYRKQVYLTGGIGSSRQNEGFSTDYDLPNESAYAETCAAIASVFLNHRLLNQTGESRFADELERALYNGVLSGLSLEGDAFFYVNPLAFDPARVDIKDPYVKSRRVPWFGCACCPPNLARLLASLGQYVYSESDRAVFVHLFIQSTATLQVGGTTLRLEQITDYPWKGKTLFKFHLEVPCDFELHVRLPGWCREGSAYLNGEPLRAELDKGYIILKRTWLPGEQLEIRMSMPVQRVHSHPLVLQNTGKVALQRGPIVYCLEGLDHEVPLASLILSPQHEMVALHERQLLGGVTTLHGEAMLLSSDGWKDKLYQFPRGAFRTVPIKAVPYFSWANRGPSEMKVWLSETC